MKTFKVKNGKKTYIVKAADKDSALDKLVEKGCIEKIEDDDRKRKAQEWVDYDLKHYGKVSEETKADIKKMGLDFDKWDNQVEDESPERKAQEWVDYDIKHLGHVSEETKNDIKKMGLDFDKWNNQVKKDCNCKPISDCDMSNVEVKDAANFTKYQYVDACKYIDDAWYKITDNVADGILQVVGLTNRVFDNAWTKLKNLIDKDDKLSDTDKVELKKYF